MAAFTRMSPAPFREVTMLEFFLSIRKEGRKAALLHVEPRSGKARGGAVVYPLKAADLRRAGRDLFAAGADSWLCSSSVHHPEEYGCRLDVAGLIEEGFNGEREKESAVAKSLWAKIMAAVDTPRFRGELSPVESRLFDRELAAGGKRPRRRSKKG